MSGPWAFEGITGKPHLGSRTFAALPAASTCAGYTAYCTDLEAAMVSNGTVWKPLGGGRHRFPRGFSIPIGTMPPGVMGNNGSITGITPMLVQYGGQWAYFKAGDIGAGVPAGHYWFVSTSATTGIVYANAYVPGTEPTRPTTLVPFITTGPGAYGSATIEVFHYSAILPGGLLGNSGTLTTRIRGESLGTGSKTLVIRLGPSAAAIHAYNNTTQVHPFVEYYFNNMGSPALNESSDWYSPGVYGTSYIWKKFSIDTSVDNVLTLSSVNTNTDAYWFSFLDFEVAPK